jgi:hypothetical protein
MWDHRVMPPFNFDREQSLASIARVARLLAEHDAQLWIGHDKDMTARIDTAPRFYDWRPVRGVQILAPSCVSICSR